MRAVGAVTASEEFVMRRLSPGEQLWFWFRGRVLGRPLLELEHACLTRAHWYPSDDPSRPWKASVRSEDWVLAIDAGRSRLVLSIAGREIGDVTVWPREWTIPGQEPGPLEAALRIARLG
jgi:hypothetical protein